MTQLQQLLCSISFSGITSRLDELKYFSYVSAQYPVNQFLHITNKIKKKKKKKETLPLKL